MSFYQLEQAARIIPHDASIQLHDGWVCFLRPGYQTQFFNTNSGTGLVEMAYRAVEEWQRYRDASASEHVAALAKSAYVGLSARERVEQRCLEQAEADRKLFESVATLLWDVSLGLDREYLPVRYHPALDWLESEAKKRGSKPWREYVE